MVDSSRVDEPPAGDVISTDRLWLSRRWLAPGPMLLILSCCVTLGAKLAVIARRHPGNLAGELVEAWPCDIVFFACCAALAAVVHMMLGARSAARVNLIAASLILAWSGLNAAWLVASGVQLQPGVLAVLIRDPAAFWPVVRSHFVARPTFSIPFVLIAGVSVFWVLRGLLRPRRFDLAVRQHGVVVVLAMAVAAASFVIHRIAQRQGVTAYSGQVIAFSSHWYAIVNTVRDASPAGDVERPDRHIARAGDRTIPSRRDGTSQPNVVIVLLESVSLDSTGFVRPAVRTPQLLALAEEGVTFTNTRVPVPLTSKAWWATLTGTTPDIQPDNAETVLADRPYESLASVLGRDGYRSAFFQMARGSFECAPGIFANMDFDWAWFRENLEDESAHLGYMNGDDFRMLDPMFEWVDREAAPFLLVMITSVSHDPYVLPAWYDEPPAATEHERYLQTIEFSDVFLGRVLEELEQRGLSQDTLVCVLGDHGEGFRPEAKSGRFVPYEEVLRVPWVMRLPGKAEAGSRRDWPCSQLDVTPTILSLLGYDISEAQFDGVNAMEPQSPDRELFFSSWYRDAPLGSVRGNRKLVYWPYTDKLYEYDLGTDPQERSPVLVEGPGKDEAVRHLVQWQESSRVSIDARRFRRRMLYEHWPTFSDGRFAQSYYVRTLDTGKQ